MCQLDSAVDLEILSALNEGLTKVYSIYKKVPLASLATVYRHLKALEERGFVEHEDGEYRITFKGILALAYWENPKAIMTLREKYPDLTGEEIQEYVKALCNKVKRLDYLPVESLEDTLFFLIHDFKDFERFKGTKVERVMAYLCVSRCPILQGKLKPELGVSALEREIDKCHQRFSHD